MTIKAEITDVSIGAFTIAGLMNENGEFGVAVPQVADLFEASRNTMSRDLKRLLGAGFETSKWKTPFNQKAVNVITLDQFQSVIRALDKKGNSAASRFVDAMFGLSLHQLFSDAFGKKFEADDRQIWLNARLATKVDFRPLTDQLKAHGFKEPREYALFIGAFQTKLGIIAGSRDKLPADILINLQGVQVRLRTLMECGIKPWDALKRI